MRSVTHRSFRSRLPRLPELRIESNALSLKSHLYSPDRILGPPFLEPHGKILWPEGPPSTVYLSEQCSNYLSFEKKNQCFKSKFKKKRKATYERIVLVSFHCQLDTIWSHPN